MAKRAPLVSQHLENISREALEKYQAIVRQYVRRRRGVYALYRRDKLYYVGLASSLSSRLEQHLKNRHKQSWDRFSVYLTIGDSHLKELESLILRIVKPIRNKQSGKFVSAEDLHRKFANDIRELHSQELISLIGRKTIAGIERKPKSSPEGRQPVLAYYSSKPLELRAKYKGNLIRARVRQNGLISLNGKTYRSPSLAGAAACQRRTCNGWTFWEYERAPGDWIKLDELRK